MSSKNPKVAVVNCLLRPGEVANLEAVKAGLAKRLGRDIATSLAFREALKIAAAKLGKPTGA